LGGASQGAAVQGRTRATDEWSTSHHFRARSPGKGRVTPCRFKSLEPPEGSSQCALYTARAPFPARFCQGTICAGRAGRLLD
jgi:hypothetical protein